VRRPVVCGPCRVQASKRNLRPSPGALRILGLLLVISSSAQALNDSQKTAVSPNPAAATSLPQNKIWTTFDAGQALAEAKTITDFGPRPSGSESNKQVRKHIVDRLAALGWQPTEQRFAEHAPEGQEIEFCNLSARFAKSQTSAKRILIGAHFDTPIVQEFRDAGASDGAANTAVLIEIARVLATDPKLAGDVELLFIDGDTPFRELNLNDGLFGSRFYAQTLHVDEHAGDIQAAVVVGNAGGQNLNYLPNSTESVIDSFEKAATALGVTLEPANRSMLADHVPFAQVGIPSITLLDADSPFLHTADDTADRLNGDSLAKTGRLILYYIATETAHR
jgi:glutaminyl-peptide cyclotransferase